MFSFDRFLAEIIQVNFREDTQYGQHQLSPRRSEIQSLLNRSKRNANGAEVIQSSEQACQVTIKTVNLIHHNHVKFLVLASCIILARSGRWLSFFAEMPASV